jgi:segregation and condensation protein B
MENIKHIIESLLFVANDPLTMERIKKIIPHAETPEIRDALAALAAEYEGRFGGFFLDEVAGGYQIRTRPEYTEWIKKLVQPKPLRLSKAALETLVIIAYKQPIIRSDIEHLRGVDCGGVLRVLLERQLIRVLGRREIAGRPLIYATTKHFLEVFDLKTLRDLPTPKEIEELGASLAESDQSVVFDSVLESDDDEEAPEAYDTEPDSSEGPEASGNRTPEYYEPAEVETPPSSAVPAPDDEAEAVRDTLLENEVESSEAKLTEKDKENNL